MAGAGVQDILLDGPWRHRDIAANGIRFHVALGEHFSPRRPLVVLLHGFGEFWWAWRHQVPALDAAGFEPRHTERVLFPPWTTEWITERGRQRLHDYGIAPPSEATTAECPQCGSSDTVEVSRFGSTPCKAQWRCNACHEPFDRFKCH